MRPVNHLRQAGLTLIELMISVGIMAFVLAIGVPSMSRWMDTNKAKAATEFYGEGLQMARREAVTHNARSRIVFSKNEANGQYNWQVDICFPVTGTPCSDSSGTWSTTTDPAANDPEGSKGFKSVARSAEALPKSSVMAPVLEPAGSEAIYFTELGWVDTAINDRVSRIRLNPSSAFKSEIPTVALMVTLSGMTSKCDPTRSAGDSRACPE